MKKFRLDLDEGTSDEIFEILQELINRAKENRDDVVMMYVLPLLQKFGESLIRAKKLTGPSRGYTLPKIRKHRSFN